MPSAGTLIAIAGGLAAAYFLVHTLRAYVRWRGARAVTCPENRCVAGIEVNAARAALTLGLRLENCSRWPERQGCGQECLAQVAAAPEDCLVRTILAKWYAGKSCTCCGKPIGEIDWINNKPALMGPDRISKEWSRVEADRVYEVLKDHQPVCWTCHVTNTFVRTHPELVVDRSGLR